MAHLENAAFLLFSSDSEQTPHFYNLSIPSPQRRLCCDRLVFLRGTYSASIRHGWSLHCNS